MILAYHRINPWYGKDALSVTADCLEKQIKYLLKKKFRPVSPYALSTPGLLDFLITFDDGYADNLWYAIPVLKKFGITPVIFLTVDYIGSDHIFDRYRDKEKDRLLNWDEVKNMSGEGVVFGSHSLSHPRLTQIADDRLWIEISDSKKTIEDRTGKEVSFFCYPYGDFNEKVIEMVKKAGYKAAVVTAGVRKSVRDSAYTLSRIGIYGHNSFLAFRMKIWRYLLVEKR